MAAAERTDRLGWAGITLGLLAWALSVPVLAGIMRANEAAARQERIYLTARAAQGIAHLHALAVLAGLVLVALQIASLLALTFGIRAVFRLRAAVCFSLAAAVPMLLDGLGLLALLIWLRLSLGAG